MQHQLWLMTLGNNLSLAPLKREPQHVLDVGTGTGIWAIEYGNFNCTSNLDHILQSANNNST
jgi:ubiquinone/menaquinone biosynthesis C-methylase UbiE